jgi:hypothetical protein
MVEQQTEKVSVKTLGIAVGVSLASAIVFKGLYSLSSSSDTHEVNGVVYTEGAESMGDHVANELSKIAIRAAIMPS